MIYVYNLIWENERIRRVRCPPRTSPSKMHT